MNAVRPAAIAAIALAFLAAAGLGAQASGQGAASVDLNEYYRFPASLAFEYGSLSPLTALNGPYSIFGLSGRATVPLPGLPVLQPFAQGGYTRFNSLDSQFPGKWDHYHLEGSLGLAYSNRIAKNFEAGASLSAGYSYAVFPSVVADGPVQSSYLILGAGGRLSLNPSYAFSLDFHPELRYQRALGDMNLLDGLFLSIGISASFRFGDDPDSARAIIRSLRLERAEIPPAFSAMQGYYATNPIGRVSITNTEKQAVTDVEVSFNQKEYMDAPTPSFSASRIEGGKTVEVPLKAVFNSRVYELEGGLGYAPLTGEVIVSYKLGSRSAEQRYPVTYNLYDKRAMTWDDDRKAAAFITPLDRSLKNYTAFISEASKAASLSGWNPALQSAMQVYDAMRELGIYYQEDAAAPFTKVQGDRSFVDFISMPRDTLSRKYGDCKNLTVLFCSLLETKNVRTGFITVPGHIYPVIDTGQSAAAYMDVYPDRTMTIALDGTLWVPVEVTMLDGKSDFLAAWRRAIEEWKTYEKERAFYKTREAQAVYAPVALQQTDLGLQYGNGDRIAGFFSQDLDALTGAIVAAYAAAAAKSGDKKDYNRLGIAAARLRRFKDAETAFSSALKADPKYVSALINLGNLSYMRGDFSKAVDSYNRTIPLIGSPAKGSPAASSSVIALVNASRAYTAMKRDKESQAALAQAKGIDAEAVSRLAVPPPGSGVEGVRAGDASAQGYPAFDEGSP